ITRPDGTQMSDSTAYTVLESLEERAKKSKGQVPPFEIIPINPDDDPEQWGTVWPALAEAPDEAQREDAYRPIKTAAGLVVYYSTIFAPYSAQIEKLKTESETLARLFRTNYEIWIAYHAILQESSRSNGHVETIGADIMDKLLEDDRIRVAQMQVKEALQ